MIKLTKKETEILEIIKKRQPISKYGIYKLSKYYSYSTIWNGIQTLLIREIITEKTIINKNNRAETIIEVKNEDKLD